MSEPDDEAKARRALMLIWPRMPESQIVLDVPILAPLFAAASAEGERRGLDRAARELREVYGEAALAKRIHALASAPPEDKR